MFGGRGDGTCMISLGILAKDSNKEKSVQPGSAQNENTARGCGG